MNGRMYDPMQGRFLSPDNHIQDPFNTQNFNRYGYVLNNPLTLTDPSGEFIETLFVIVKIVSAVFTTIQTVSAIVSGAPIGQILLGIGIGALAGALGGSIAGAVKDIFSAASTAVGAFIRGAVSAFAGQLISGTLASVVQGTSFRKALRANLAPAGIAAAAGGIAGASEFKANKRALAKQQFENRKQLEAMAELANDNLSKTMTTPEQLASNANAKWGPGELRLKTTSFRNSISKYSWPTNHRVVTSKYDLNRMHPRLNVARPHRGTDIRARLGESIKSIDSGFVSKVQTNGLGNGGNFIKVKHSNGVESGYFHTKSSLKWGDFVSKGQVIGISDGSGLINAPHLHLSLRVGNQLVDPMNYLRN